jgi:DNA repair protein RecN (Recombination protein N)
MLTTLRIKNLALVADLTLELGPGYNAITGETGAGKSIIIGALNLVLGERADRTLIRSGSDACSVEAVFDVSGLKSHLAPLIEENGLEPCEENQLVLKRTFTQTGTNRQFVNGSPTTLGVLGDLGQWLVDMHGPHDHQSLLHVSRQLDILDAFGNLQAARKNFAGLVKQRAALETEKASLIVDEKTYAQQMDLLRHQVGEIGAARLEPGEEAGLVIEHQRSGNASKLLELCQSALDMISESEGSLLTNSGLLGRTVSELQRLDPGVKNIGETHAQLVENLRDLHAELSHYADKIDVDPARLHELEARLDAIHTLKRKYGGSIDDVIAFGKEAASRLDLLEKRDVELERINSQLAKLNEELWRKGGELSAQRRKIIPQLAKAATKQLKDLGFAQCHFDISQVSLEKTAFIHGNAALSPQGFDTVEFQFSPNLGEPLRPLRSIASSGEMARVMLALKTVLAQVDEIPVLVFDEVDANVGGETALTVGQKMRQIASQRQVLCITHLAPVAASATSHYLVSKQTKDGRTVSEITLLGKKERITEISRMLGGQSAAIQKHAEELLGKTTRD